LCFLRFFFALVASVGLAVAFVVGWQLLSPSCSLAASSSCAERLLLAEIEGLRSIGEDAPVVFGTKGERSRFAAELSGRFWIDSGRYAELVSSTETLAQHAPLLVSASSIAAVRSLAVLFGLPTLLLFSVMGFLSGPTMRLVIPNPRTATPPTRLLTWKLSFAVAGSAVYLGFPGSLSVSSALVPLCAVVFVFSNRKAAMLILSRTVSL
jgi:hypothetical protein